MKPLIFVAILFSTSTIFAQHDFDSLYHADKAYQGFFDKWQNEESIYRDDAPIFHMELKADFKSIAESKDSSAYWPAQMTISLNDTVTYRTKLKVKPRGMMRKKICNFPPLKLNFPKKGMVFKELKEFDKVKMVQSCKEGENYEQYIISEYLAYKMYNLITDMSFKVRLFKITFIDTGGAFPSEEKFAFLIEPFEELAARLDMKPVKEEVSGLLEHETNWDQAGTVDVFQYMIANCDWAIANGHNMKLLKSKDPNDKLPYSVPYDFDYSGFVNAPYASPPRILPISRVTERFYMGACRPKKEMRKKFELFFKKQDDIMQLIQTEQNLPDPIKNRLVYFVAMFYAMIEDNEYADEFRTLCR